MLRLFAFVVMVAVPATAIANAGIPMLALAWPAHWLAFVPVVLLEGALARKQLEVETRKAMKVSFYANLVSTFVGVPIAWLAMLLLEFAVSISFFWVENEQALRVLDIALFPFMVAWLPPIENVWVVYLGFVILMVPLCAASVVVERIVATRSLSSISTNAVRAWALRANIISYLLLVVCSAAYFGILASKAT